MQGKRWKQGFSLACCLGVLVPVQSVNAADLVVSANEGKVQRIKGQLVFADPPEARDSLAVIDMEQHPPRVLGVLEGVDVTLAGPPQAVAITPDGKLAVVGAPSRYEYQAHAEILEGFLQLVDLSDPAHPQATQRIDLGVQTNGLSINPAGDLLLAAGIDGNLYVLKLAGRQASLINRIRISDDWLSGVSFTADGQAAVVARRQDGGAAVLKVDGDQVTLTSEVISTGVAPYCVDVSADGRWAVIGNVGLAGLHGGTSPADLDSVTLVDTSKHPFRAVGHFGIPAGPEGLAISPDGKWIAVQSTLGSALPPSNPAWTAGGKVSLWAIENGQLIPHGTLPSGVAAQGVVFSKDSRTLLVQNNVERQLLVYAIENGQLTDTGTRLPLAAGPSSIRSMPRGAH